MTIDEEQIIDDLVDQRAQLLRALKNAERWIVETTQHPDHHHHPTLAGIRKVIREIESRPTYAYPEETQ